MKCVKYRIRPCRTIAEYHACEDLQQAVWQFTEREIIPVNELITIQRNGGLVLGAFAGRGRMIGFAFGFPGFHHKKLIHSSRMVAVLPKYRNSDIGYRLKSAQRAFVRKQGIDLITWTFDPLQSVNAYFNIEKLGVVIREYYVNLYGTSSSILNKGLETDRFLAEWSLKSRHSQHIAHIPHQDDSLVVNPTHYNKEGWLVCGSPRLNLKEPYLFVEIPADIMSLKKADMILARAWRRQTRRIFTNYFKRGYWVTRFLSKEINHHRRSFYILFYTRPVRTR